MKRISTTIKVIYPFFVAIIAPFVMAFPAAKFNEWVITHFRRPKEEAIGAMICVSVFLPGI
jgi:hypothetical protein